MAKEKRIKEPIKLRQKKIADGNVSLYLDIYWNGKRSYEFLKLYLIPERTKEDKEKNRQTLQLANSVKAKRIVEMQNGSFGFKSDFATDTLFFDYYRAMCQKRLGAESRSNWGNWFSCLHHLKRYEKNDRITFAEITPDWVDGFREYLDDDARAWEHDKRKRDKEKPLARNSKLSYFNKLRACLNHAFDDRIIPVNPCRGVENFKAEEGTRMYLTIDEVRKIAQTECEYPRIIFRQKKTKGQEYLDITGQAAALMGKRGDPADLVFEDIHSPTRTNRAVQEWVSRAGINKKITFHAKRHREFYKHQIINRLNCLSMTGGNDKETSELLYPTLFCHFKEPLCVLQRYGYIVRKKNRYSYT